MNLSIRELLQSYRSGRLRPGEVMESIYARIAAQGDDHVWIHLVPREVALARAGSLESEPPNAPLYGIPFAVKDILDVAGLPTTGACPAYSYIAARTATLARESGN